ncbi:MAG: hypothetical protein MEQ07_08425 [Aquimonas sp.]|nr:hypothetical protein [Aquimonas sp.]
MNLRRVLAVLGLGCPVLVPAQAHAETPPSEVERVAEHGLVEGDAHSAEDHDPPDHEALVDPRLRAVLEAEGLEYTVGHGGDLEVLIRFSDDSRSQFVRLQSSTRRYRNIEFRDIYSTAYQFDLSRGLDPALARRLLEANNTYTVGFWAVQDDRVFSIARIPGQASPAMVREAIRFVAAEADELERELLGSDDY